MIDFENFDDVFGYLQDNDYFTYNELILVTCINGDSIDTLNDMIYARYGYNDLKQMLGEDYE